jgi:hypothetical protein
MNPARSIRIDSIFFLACTGISLLISPATGAEKAPPDWKASAAGASTLQGVIVRDGVPYLVDRDFFQGTSSHLGRFTGEGFHFLNLVDLSSFDGFAVWTASNGDELHVTFAGNLFVPSGDPDFPFGAIADFQAVGGTGRFADARGSGVLTGAFTGDPLRAYYFDVQGTIHPQGRQ